MFTNVTTGHNLSSVTLEILIMLAVAFALGFLLAWLLNSSDDTVADATVDHSDLTVVDGIGPKIQELLNSADITTLANLANTETSDLLKILQAAGPRFRIHDPATWADQAQLAFEGRWDDLKQYQEVLVGGKTHL